MEALSVINLLPDTNSQVKTFSDLIINEVKAGNKDPLKLKAQLKFIEKSFELIDKGIREYYLSEASKYGKNFELHGFKIQYSENISPKYDYKQCNDPKWNELDELIKKLSEQKKDREQFLRSIQGHVEVAEEGTGEMKVVTPPTKKSTTGLIMEAI